MVYGLAIETSGRNGSIAILRDGVSMGTRVFTHGLQHAAEMLPAIDSLTSRLGLKPPDFTQAYVSAGPGSFTGLRIGITLVKTLCLCGDIQIVAVPSVRVLVENAPPESRDAAIVLDAKRSQIYTALYHRDTDAEPWKTVEDAHLDSLSQLLSRAPRPIHLLGEGIPFHESFIPKEEGIFIASVESWRCRAEAVGELGYAIASRAEFADPLKLTPIYIRPPEAEEKYNAANCG
jgi:tRNA threonylcarbamoyladenosine biosynthesis protein TsaB